MLRRPLPGSCPARAFRRYLEGLLLPTERNKTLTALANTEPVAGAQRREAQSLQWFLSESGWDPKAVNERRLGVLLGDAKTAPHGSGALVIDETGDRKDGKKTAHVGRQYLGGIGKIENGVVSVSSLWADERLYYPLMVEPYTPAHHFAGGKADPALRTKPKIALELVGAGSEPGSLSGRWWRTSSTGNTAGSGKRSKRRRAPRAGIGAFPRLVAPHRGAGLRRRGGASVRVERSEEPGGWVRLAERALRDGRTEEWWALEAERRPDGPEKGRPSGWWSSPPIRMCPPSAPPATRGPTFPRRDRGEPSAALAPASVAEVVSHYGLRMWVEQSYKQVKQSLGRAQYQVRKDISIRRHWQMVCCAFAFCWWAYGRLPASP